MTFLAKCSRLDWIHTYDRTYDFRSDLAVNKIAQRRESRSTIFRCNAVEVMAKRERNMLAPGGKIVFTLACFIYFLIVCFFLHEYGSRRLSTLAERSNSTRGLKKKQTYSSHVLLIRYIVLG